MLANSAENMGLACYGGKRMDKLAEKRLKKNRKSKYDTQESLTLLVLTVPTETYNGISSENQLDVCAAG